MSTIHPFDGSINVGDHLDKAHMYIHLMDDATCCLYLLVVLKAVTQAWFNSLPNRSITLFLQLVELYNAYLIASKGKEN